MKPSGMPLKCVQRGTKIRFLIRTRLVVQGKNHRLDPFFTPIFLKGAYLFTTESIFVKKKKKIEN